MKTKTLCYPRNDLAHRGYKVSVGRYWLGGNKQLRRCKYISGRFCVWFKGKFRTAQSHDFEFVNK